MYIPYIECTTQDFTFRFQVLVHNTYISRSIEVPDIDNMNSISLYIISLRQY